MKPTMINAKVNSATKRQVDIVLKSNNTTTSEVIRTLWDYIAETQSLPDFFTKTPRRAPSATKRMKQRQLLSLAGIIHSNGVDNDQVLLEALETRNA